MKTQLNQSLLNGLRVMECLFDNDFEDKTVADVMDATGLKHITVWRTLKTLESRDWAKEIQRGKQESLWKASLRLVEIAAAYERNALKRVQTIHNEYRQVTGKELQA